MVIKKHILVLILLLCSAHVFICGFAFSGQDIVVVQSLRIAPYEKAIEGAESVCGTRLQRLVMSEFKGDEFERELNRISPRLILAVGANALAKVRQVEKIPVVYMMVLNPMASFSDGEQNITGVSMNISQEKQLTELIKLMPDAKNIGVIFDPDRTGFFVSRALKTAENLGVKLITHEVKNSKDVIAGIMDMKSRVDIFWMLPDLTVITPETLKFLFLFSLENKIPVMTFSENYLKMGALISMNIDAFDMGRQAGEMVNQILSGKKVKSIRQVGARKADIIINKKIAKKMGVIIDSRILYKNEYYYCSKAFFTSFF